VELRVDLYSDMCGIFRDRLIVQVMGLPQVVIPVVGKVTGEAVRFEGATLGLNLVGETPSLDFGDVLLRGPAQNRSLRVANYSPWPMQVTWRLLESAPASGQNLVTLSSTVGPDGTIAYSVTAVEPEEAKLGDTPFTLERAVTVIPPHKTKAINISCACDAPAHHANYLVGQVAVLPKDAVIPGEETAADKGKGVSEALQMEDAEDADVAILQGQLTGHKLVSMEQLVVGMRCEATSARLETDSSKHLKWICSTSHDHKTHPSYVKEINLSNRGRCNQTFSLSVHLPFTIESTSCTAPIHPLLPPPLGADSLTRPQMFTLPPNDTVVVRVRFNLPAKHRTSRTVDDAHLFGELKAVFENEEVQVMQLEALIIHPSLQVAPAELNFQTLHVESTSRVTICLTNAAYADASWSIVHAPRMTTLTTSLNTRSGTLAGTQKPQGPEDDVEAFSFHPPSGHIKGTAHRPTRPAVQMVTVEFHPKVNHAYRSRFKIEIESGRQEFIYLEGCGSYDENMEPGGSSGVIRDHPGMHPAMSGVLAPVLPNEEAIGAERGARPPPETLPSWYDMDKAMAPQHLTSFTLQTGFAPATGVWEAPRP